MITGRNPCPGPVLTTFVGLSPALPSEPAPTHPMSSDISSDYTGPVGSFIFQRPTLLTHRLPSLQTRWGISNHLHFKDNKSRLCSFSNLSSLTKAASRRIQALTHLTPSKFQHRPSWSLNSSLLRNLNRQLAVWA